MNALRRPRGLLPNKESPWAPVARVLVLSVVAAGLFILSLAVTVLVVTD